MRWMAARTKRKNTGYGSSQDAAGDRAVEEQDRAVQDEAEASRWADAAKDREFATEARADRGSFSANRIAGRRDRRPTS